MHANYAEIIERFRSEGIQRELQEQLAFFSRPSLELREAINHASVGVYRTSEDFIVHHNHFLSLIRNQGKEPLYEARKVLLRNPYSLRTATNFNDLYDRVQMLTETVHGFGELMTYDVSLFIGSNIGKLPSDVYVQAGAKKGAIQLLGREVVGSSRYLPTEMFQSSFGELKAHEIEALLCVYAEDIPPLA